MCTEYSKTFYAVIKFYGTPLNLSSLTLIKCRNLPPPTVMKLVNSESFICWFLIPHSHNFHNNCRKVWYEFHFPDFHEIHKQKNNFLPTRLVSNFIKMEEKETVDKILFLLLLK